MPCYAVIDTNVFVAALLTKKADSATLQVVNAMLSGDIIPLFHQEILEEYDEVLHRRKFHLQEETIQTILIAIQEFGIEVFPNPTGEVLIDMEGLIFYEVAVEKQDEDAYLITGNQKHYPERDFIVTPREMLSILREHDKEFREML